MNEISPVPFPTGRTKGQRSHRRAHGRQTACVHEARTLTCNSVLVQLGRPAGPDTEKFFAEAPVDNGPGETCEGIDEEVSPTIAFNYKEE